MSETPTTDAVPSTTAPTGGTSTSAPATTTPAATDLASQRVPDTYPDPRFRGRTFEEVLRFGSQALDALATPAQSAPAAPTASAPAYQPASTPAFDPDAYLTGRDLQAYQQQLVQATVAPQIERALSAVASLAEDRIRERYKDVFDDPAWELEYRQIVNQVPVRDRSPETLEWAAKVVKGNHAEEIVERRLRERTQPVNPTFRPDGSAPPASPSTDPLEQAGVPTEWLARAKQAGLTMREIREHLRATGETEAQFFATLKKYGERMRVVREG